MGKNETQGSVIQVGAIMEKITFTLSVHSIRYEGASTRLIELRPPAGTYLPPVEAGAHIDVHCGEGIIRQYSLCGDPNDRRNLMIAVNHGNPSRGGSELMHKKVKEGDNLEIGSPRNNFLLDETQAHTILIAGGIGITPFLSLSKDLQQDIRFLIEGRTAKTLNVDQLLLDIIDQN